MSGDCRPRDSEVSGQRGPQRERERDSIKVLKCEVLMVHHSYNYMTTLSDVGRKQCRMTRPESRQLTCEHGTET